MKAILFCNLPYAFSILRPIERVLRQESVAYLWYLPQELLKDFPYADTDHTSSIETLETFDSDMIFVPGNQIPWFLPGVKVQIFHGLAGEKKGHFRIRHYFDLYLTQGPYFTERFNNSAKLYGDFEVVETGWSKLDTLFVQHPQIEIRKKNLLEESGSKYILLYAPTFSPSLTSADILLEHIVRLSGLHDYLLIVKFHDKMDPRTLDKYRHLESAKLRILRDRDITESLQLSDLMISDTSSAVYEFLLLDKPVITLNSQSENIQWADIGEAGLLTGTVAAQLTGSDEYAQKRKRIIELYHPYRDGNSSKRMYDAVVDYIKRHGVPKKRNISLLRKLKTIKKYRLLRW